MNKIANALKLASWGLCSFALSAPLALAEDCTRKDGLCNPIKANDFTELLATILEIVVAIGIPVIIIAIIFVGFKFITAQGKEKDISEARQALWWVLIGAAIVLGAKVIVAIITSTVGKL